MANKLAATFGWILHPEERELEQVREINAHLPFADPIELVWETDKPIPVRTWVQVRATLS